MKAADVVETMKKRGKRKAGKCSSKFRRAVKKIARKDVDNPYVVAHAALD